MASTQRTTFGIVEVLGVSILPGLDLCLSTLAHPGGDVNANALITHWNISPEQAKWLVAYIEAGLRESAQSARAPVIDDDPAA